MSTTESAAPKGLFRSLTRSKSKKKHAPSSSADGHQPPSLASCGQANTAAGTGLAGVGGIGAGGLGRAATLREKTRAQMGAPGGGVPALPTSTSSSALAAAAAGGGGPGQRPVQRSPSQGQVGGQQHEPPRQQDQQLYPRPMERAPDGTLGSPDGRHARQPSYTRQQQQQTSQLQLRKQPSQSSASSSAAAGHARHPSDPSTYSASSSHRTPSHQSHEDADDGYGDLLDAYDEDDPRSPTSPVTPQPPLQARPQAQQPHQHQRQESATTAAARQGMQTITLRDGTTIETPLPPNASPKPTGEPSPGRLPFQASQAQGGRSRVKSVSRDQAPPSSFTSHPPPPVPPLPTQTAPPARVTAPDARSTPDRPPSASSHSRLPTSASSIDSPMVTTPSSDPHALPPALAQYVGGPKAPTVSQGEVPQDRFVVSLGAEDGGRKEESGGGWGKVKRGLTVRRKEKPAPTSDRPPSPPRVAAAPTMYSAATLAMQMAAAERKAGRTRHDPNAIGGGALSGRGREEERLTESAFM